MRKIIFTRPDGRLSVVHPVRNTLDETLTTDAEIEQRAWDRLPADAMNPQWVDASVIPVDRTFRNAWKAELGAVEHDMPKCREIWRDTLRALRMPLLAQLDIDYLRADERGDAAEKARIAAQKQRLRDVTADPAIEAAQTPEELKSVIPHGSMSK